MNIAITRVMMSYMINDCDKNIDIENVEGSHEEKRTEGLDIYTGNQSCLRHPKYQFTMS